MSNDVLNIKEEQTFAQLEQDMYARLQELREIGSWVEEKHKYPNAVFADLAELEAEKKTALSAYKQAEAAYLAKKTQQST